jgi:hypothetical protein
VPASEAIGSHTHPFSFSIKLIPVTKATTNSQSQQKLLKTQEHARVVGAILQLEAGKPANTTLKRCPWGYHRPGGS